MGYRPERDRREPPRHGDGAPGRQCGERRRDQAVDVEQGHHAERDILRPKLVGRNDVGHRRGQVAVAQRHPLGTAGGPAGVEDEGDVVLARRQHRAGGSSHHVALHMKSAVAVDLRFDHRAGAVEGRARRGRVARWHQQKPSAGVFEVVAEFGLRVGGVEGTGRGDVRRRQKEDDRLGSDRKDHRHPVAGANAERRQAERGLLDQLAEPGIGEDGAARDRKRRLAGRTTKQQGRNVRHDRLSVCRSLLALPIGLAFRQESLHALLEVTGHVTGHDQIRVRVFGDHSVA
jgi:hypothetical protein